METPGVRRVLGLEMSLDAAIADHRDLAVWELEQRIEAARAGLTAEERAWLDAREG